MKTIILGLALITLANSASALDRAQLDNRVRRLTLQFQELQQKPDKQIPAEKLRQAKGILLLDTIKAGFGFAYQGGGGVAMVRDKSDRWSPVAFVNFNQGSIGFQIGGEHNFLVVLLMTTNATHRLTQPTLRFAGEASGTAGNSSSGVQSDINSPQQSVLVYADRTGLFGGVAIKGGTVSADDQADGVYYHKYRTIGDILFHRAVAPTDAAKALAQKIAKYSKQ